MEIKEVISWNKLIADFMGAKIKGAKGAYQYRIDEQDWAEEGLRYYTNWNWLMPVIEKIESLGFYVSIMKSNVTCAKDFDITSIHEIYNYKDKHEAVWTVIVKFIEWYNQQNKK